MLAARLLPFIVPAVLAGIYAATACSPVQNSRIGIDAPPFTDEEFHPVADYLGNRCGTLDCHGSTGRNFRVWGCEGMRFAQDADPSSCVNPTTEAEYQATYRSLVGLEPQLMTTVYGGCAAAIADGGQEYPPGDLCHPELLTFIQKARGAQAHKGGQLICVTPPCADGIPAQVPLDGEGGPGSLYVDPQDVCLVSWLEGATDKHFCGLAFGIPNFPLLEAGAP